MQVGALVSSTLATVSYSRYGPLVFYCLALHSAGWDEGGRLSKDVAGSQLCETAICNLHSVEYVVCIRQEGRACVFLASTL